MLKSLAKNAHVVEFLQLYPKPEWRSCIEYALVIGISTLKRDYPVALTSAQLRNLYDQTLHDLAKPQLPNVRAMISSLKEQVALLDESYNQADQALTSMLNVGGYVERAEEKPRQAVRKLRSPKVGGETPRFNLTEATKRSPNSRPSRPASTSPYIGTSIKATYSPALHNALLDSRRKLPGYLKNVPSKIKREVRRDIASYKAKENIPLDDFGHSQLQQYSEYSQRGLYDDPCSTSNYILETLEEGRSEDSMSLQGLSGLHQLESFDDTGRKIDARSLQGRPKDSFKPKLDLDFETPRNPPQVPPLEETDVLKIADSFLSDPLMAQISSGRSDRLKSKTMPTSPMTFISSADQSMNSHSSFREKWNEETKNIGVSQANSKNSSFVNLKLDLDTSLSRQSSLKASVKQRSNEGRNRRHHGLDSDVGRDNASAMSAHVPPSDSSSKFASSIWSSSYRVETPSLSTSMYDMEDIEPMFKDSQLISFYDSSL